MRIEADDAGFVRARRTDVHPVLADLGGYPTWWPDAQGAPVKGGVALTLRPPRALGSVLFPPRHRVVATLVKDRPGLGVRMRYSGDVAGRAEWYYFDTVDGVLVHYLVAAEVADRRWLATLRAHRLAVRAALNELKDRFEGARVPGAEPSVQLLADQQQAIAEFRAGVQAHARSVEASGSGAS
jgi:hypothetical protein